MKWIRTDDILKPANELYVLIWNIRGYNGGVYKEEPCVGIGQYFQDLKQWRPVGGNGNFNDIITHWMPMPEGPKE